MRDSTRLSRTGTSGWWDGTPTLCGVAGSGVKIQDLSPPTLQHLRGESNDNEQQFSSKMETMVFLLSTLVSAATSHPGHFVAAVDGVHAADVVGAGHVVDTQAAALGAGDDGGAPAAAPVALHQAQREQAEVGLVLQADQARAGLAALGRHLLVRRRLLVAVHAAAQQLLVLRRSVVLTAHKGDAFSIHADALGIPKTPLKRTPPAHAPTSAYCGIRVHLSGH